jgi:hypothetical protein
MSLLHYTRSTLFPFRRSVVGKGGIDTMFVDYQVRVLHRYTYIKPTRGRRGYS